MAEPTAHGAPDAEHAHAPTSSKLYIRIAGILAAITIVEVIISLLPDPGFLAAVWVVLLLVLSLGKGALVVMYFMHLKFDSRWFTTMFVGGTAIAALMMLAFLALFTYKANLLG